MQHKMISLSDEAVEAMRSLASYDKKSKVIADNAVAKN